MKITLKQAKHTVYEDVEFEVTDVAMVPYWVFTSTCDICRFHLNDHGTQNPITVVRLHKAGKLIVHGDCLTRAQK